MVSDLLPDLKGDGSLQGLTGSPHLFMVRCYVAECSMLHKEINMIEKEYILRGFHNTPKNSLWKSGQLFRMQTFYYERDLRVRRSLNGVF